MWSGHARFCNNVCPGYKNQVWRACGQPSSGRDAVPTRLPDSFVEEPDGHIRDTIRLATVCSGRLSLDLTWDWMKLAGFNPPFDTQGKPFLPSRPPLSEIEEDRDDYDDEEDDEDYEMDEDEQSGFGYFRNLVYEGDLHNLTMPRTFFGKSEIGLFSFRNTDLSESTMRWNDWLDCDFTEANLSRGHASFAFCAMQFHLVNTLRRRSAAFQLRRL